ncbi:MAG TPA: MYXO-CTERM sorting domain-containing protein [Polyangia bacterium]|nr:MYXO-CTERM sorting domain-containing protein [Polyangia bacterium]
MSVLLPAGRPHEIVLTTNFGIITSADDGATWTWSCEQDERGSRDLYQYGAPGQLRLFARDAIGLVFSDDGGCSWGAAAGSGLAGSVVTDAFPDPIDPMRVLAVVAPMPYRLLESSDAGSTFGVLRYAAAAGVSISSVEIARSDPQTVYLVTLSSSGATFVTKLLRSTDGGASWMEHDVTGAVGSGSALIIAVDPADPLRVFLRVNTDTGNKLVITEDGGATFKAPLALTGGFMKGFALMTSGTILVTGMVGVDPVLHRSTDRGVTFETVPDPPKLWGLAERGGMLYGAGQTGERFAVGTSTDEGTTWQTLMNYSQVVAIASCVKPACQGLCQTEVDRGLWAQAVCAAAEPPRPDASTLTPPDAEADGAGDATGDAGDRGADGGTTTGGSGCSCATAEATAVFAPVLLLGAAALLARRSRPRMTTTPDTPKH